MGIKEVTKKIDRMRWQISSADRRITDLDRQIGRYIAENPTHLSSSRFSNMVNSLITELSIAMTLRHNYALWSSAPIAAPVGLSTEVRERVGEVSSASQTQSW